MSGLIQTEIKKSGINVFLITAAVLTIFTVLSAAGGNLVKWHILGFEIIFPFLITILIGECAQTLSDPIFDIIFVHSGTLFKWVAGKYLAAFIIPGSLSILCMSGLWLWVLDFSFGETLFIFITTTLFFSSIAIFTSFLSKQPHAPAAVCGTLWLLALMANSLVRYPVFAYIYPFIKFIGKNDDIWLHNKLILLLIAAVLWSAIYFICVKRRLIKF